MSPWGAWAAAFIRKASVSRWQDAGRTVAKTLQTLVVYFASHLEVAVLELLPWPSHVRCFLPFCSMVPSVMTLPSRPCHCLVPTAPGITCPCHVPTEEAKGRGKIMLYP